MVDRLLKAGARVDVKDADERTPLHWAAVNGHHVVVALLAQKQAPLGTYVQRTGLILI